MKRILSILLTIVMLLSMVTISYAADETIAVEYINANTTEFVIELSKRITAEELRGALSLTKEGEDVDVSTLDIALKDATPAPHYTEHLFLERSSKYISMRPLKAGTNATYVITPKGGVGLETEYVLSLSESLLGYEYRAKIVVKKFAADNFNYEASASPWKKASSSDAEPTYANSSLTLAGGKAVLLANTSNYFDGRTVSAYRSAYTAGKDKKINVEVDVNFATADTAKHIAGLGLAQTSTTVNIGASSLTSSVSFAVGGNTSANGRTKHTALYVAKYDANGDPDHTNYPGTKYTNFYGAATKAEGSSGNYISNADKYGMYLSGTTSSFKSGEAKRIYMYYDADKMQVMYGADGDLYTYTHDITAIAVKPIPFIFNPGTSAATFTNLVVSYPVIEEVRLIPYEIDGPTYWNASYDTVTLDFDVPLMASEIKKNVKLYDANGDSVVIESVKCLTDATKSNDSTGKYTYEIKLKEHFKDDSENPVYTLVLPAVTYKDENDVPAKIANDYIVTFAVDVFVLENFESYDEGKTAASSSNFAWALGSSRKNGTLVVTKEGDNKYLKATTTGRCWTGPLGASGKFANTGLGGYYYATATNLDAGRFKSDYTLQADVKLATEGTAGYTFSMIQAKEREASKLENSPYNDYNKVTIAKDADGSLTMSAYARGGSKTAYINSHKATACEGLKSDEYTRLSMVIKGRDHRWTVGNYTLHEMVDADVRTVQQIGIPLFDVDKDKSGNVYHIDNVILSKATEVDALVTGDIEVNGTMASGNIEKASLSVTNRGQAKTFTAILIVRKTADDSTVRAITQDVTMAANETKTVEFTNVNVSGGDSIEVYLWQSLKGMTPYAAKKVFPKN